MPLTHEDLDDLQAIDADLVAIAGLMDDAPGTSCAECGSQRKRNWAQFQAKEALLAASARVRKAAELLKSEVTS